MKANNRSNRSKLGTDRLAQFYIKAGIQLQTYRNKIPVKEEYSFKKKAYEAQHDFNEEIGD